MSLIIPTQMSIKAEIFVKIGQALSEITSPFLFTIQSEQKFLGVTAPNVTAFLHEVATFNALLSCPSMFPYTNLFWNGSTIMKICLRKTLILQL